MPIGSGIVYNTGDLILSQVSSSGTAFLETKIAAATSSIIYFDGNGRINSASLNNITVGTASYVSGSTSIITNLTASNISASTITGSLFGTSSWSTNALTASSLVQTNSYTITNLTASNISASGYISASNLRVETSIVDGGTLTVNGNSSIGNSLSNAHKVTGSLTITGSSTLYGNSSIVGTLSMNNYNIDGINGLIISDPGSGEGLTWAGGYGWSIYESPNDFSNTSGNLQFISGSGGANVRRLTLNTDGNSVFPTGSVGIGTDNPAYLLDVSGNIAISQNNAFYRSAKVDGTSIQMLGILSTDVAAVGPTNAAVGTGPALVTMNSAASVQTVYFYTNNSIRMTLNSNGKVGIGTTVPSSMLEVSSSNSSSLLNIKGSGGDGLLYVSGSGNVGIGTTNPQFLLDVVNTSTTSKLRIGNAGGNNGSQLILAGSNTTKNWVIANQQNLNGTLEFTQTTATGSSTIDTTPSMVINSNGYIGMGTTSPTSKLEVRGQVLVNNVTASSPSNQLTINTNGTNYAHFYDLGTSANTLVLGGSPTLTALPTASISASIMSWALNSGNVGIGTTNPQFLLDVSGSSRFGWSSSNTHQFTGSVSLTDGLYLTNLTASNVSSSNTLSASNVWFSNSMTYTETMSTGSLTVPDINFTSTATTGSDVMFKIDATALTGSAVALQINALGSQASYAISASNGIIAGTDFVATNLTASNVSASGVITSSGINIGGITYNESIQIDQFDYFQLQPYIEVGNFPNNVFNKIGGTSPTFTTMTGSACPFGKIAYNTSYYEAISDFIPVNPGETLYGEIWAYRSSGATGTAGVLYCGIARYDKDKNQIDANAGLTYFIASNVTVPTTSTWTKYSGTTTLPLTHASFAGSDGGPVRYIRPYVIVNYTNGTIPTYWGAFKIRKTQLTRDTGIVTISGSVGIGTTSPAYLLDVNGSGGISNLYTNNIYKKTTGSAITINAGNDAAKGLRVYYDMDVYNTINFTDSSYNAQSSIYGTSGTMVFRVNGNATTAATINNSGNVGIGTSSPRASLHIDTVNGSDANEYGGLIVSSTVSSSRGVNISYDATNDVGTITAVNTGVSWKDLTIQPTGGSVGIRTKAPVSLLDVRSGYITSGDKVSVQASKILAGYYDNGALVTLGGEYSNGGPVLGYGVWPSASAGTFISSTGINVPRGAYTIRGNVHYWYSSTGSLTASINSPVSLNSVASLDATGNFTVNAVTSSLFGTSSWANNVVSASYATTAQTANALNTANSYTIAGLTNNGTLSQQGTLSMGSGYQILATTGTTSIPGIAFVGDTNTGIYSSGADTIGLVTGGSEKVRIDSNGNVGIGSTNPTVALDVAATGVSVTNQPGIIGKFTRNVDGRALIRVINSDTNAGASATHAGISFIAYSNVSNQPSANTHEAQIMLAGTGTGTNDLKFIAPQGMTFWVSSSNVIMTGSAYANYGTQAVCITTGGVVGIGTSIPNQLLTVYKTDSSNSGISTTTAISLYNPQTVSSDYGSAIRFYGDTRGNNNFAGIAGLLTSGTAAGSTGYLTFYTKTNESDSLPTERMRITSTGNVGIGTASPSAKLEITGSSNSALLNIKSPISGAILYVSGSGAVGIGDSNVGTYRLYVSGSFGATTKSFIIDHPTKKGKKLIYGSLESPYHGIRLTGRDTLKDGKCKVELPEYIYKLILHDSVNIQLTGIKCNKTLYVDDINIPENYFTIAYDKALFESYKDYDFFWDFTAIRADVPELITEL
jgi:hypothetical protein